MSAARNYGVIHAKGDTLVILDAEDYFHPSFFYKAKEILDTRSDIVAVTSYIKNFGFNRKKFKVRGGSTYNFLFSNQSPACAMLRKADWDAIGGYDEAMKLGYEDWEFYLRLTAFTEKKVHVIPKFWFNYRQTDNSTLKNDSVPNANMLIDYLVSKNADVYLSCLKELIFEKKVLYTDSRISWQNILKMIKDRLTAKYRH
jgi:glycosyltransferase involved in cell wall biosynthesis